MSQLSWLSELANDADHLRLADSPRPYWSQRHGTSQPSVPDDLRTAVRRVRALLAEMLREFMFAETLGYACFDDNGETGASIESELDRRIAKPDLWDRDDALWTEDDLCDVIEVFHDLAARPTRGWFHSYSGCGWHPTHFARASGQKLYRWRVNGLLASTSLELRIATAGEDVGRLVRDAVPGLDDLMTSPDTLGQDVASSVAHAVALFRSRTRTRHDQRSAIVTLAGVLEQQKARLKQALLTKDENVLFELANRFDLRHRRADQYVDYDESFLEWIFHWYLATIRLLDRLARVDP